MVHFDELKTHRGSGQTVGRDDKHVEKITKTVGPSHGCQPRRCWDMGMKPSHLLSLLDLDHLAFDSLMTEACVGQSHRGRHRTQHPLGPDSAGRTGHCLPHPNVLSPCRCHRHQDYALDALTAKIP